MYAVGADSGVPAIAREALESCGIVESQGVDANQINMHMRLRVYSREERLARKADRADQAVQSKAASAAAAVLATQAKIGGVADAVMTEA